MDRDQVKKFWLNFKSPSETSACVSWCMMLLEEFSCFLLQTDSSSHWNVSSHRQHSCFSFHWCCFVFSWSKTKKSKTNSFHLYPANTEDRCQCPQRCEWRQSGPTGFWLTCFVCRWTRRAARRQRPQPWWRSDAPSTWTGRFSRPTGRSCCSSESRPSTHCCSPPEWPTHAVSRNYAAPDPQKIRPIKHFLCNNPPTTDRAFLSLFLCSLHPHPAAQRGQSSHILYWSTSTDTSVKTYSGKSRSTDSTSLLQLK